MFNPMVAVFRVVPLHSSELLVEEELQMRSDIAKGAGNVIGCIENLHILSPGRLMSSHGLQQGHVKDVENNGLLSLAASISLI